MNKKQLTGAAIALVLAPGGVSSEILSQQRLGEILSSRAPGPVNVETMRSRDRDLLVTLGATLRDKYGSVLVGSEIVFTRTERAGRIVYRMDFLNVKTSDHAKGICEILEIEKCIILSENGDASLISAEIDEDGLLSLDEYVPFSGVVRMDKLPTTQSAAEPVERTMRLPTERPEGAVTAKPEPKAAPAAVEVKPQDAPVRRDDAMRAAIEEAIVTAPAPRSPQPEPHNPQAITPDENVADEPILDPLDLDDYEMEIEIDDEHRAPGIMVEPPEIEIEVQGSDAVPVEIPEIRVAVESPQFLPLPRPSAESLASISQMDLPIERPAFAAFIPEDRMSLPGVRPVAQFGLQDYLPIDRGAAMRMAQGEPVDGDFRSRMQAERAEGGFMSLISSPTDGPKLVDDGYSIVMPSSTILEGLDGLDLNASYDLKIDLPGIGSVDMSADLPVVTVAMQQPDLEASVNETEDGLELEIAGMDSDAASHLPRVFVLSFAEDGIKAFPDAKVTSAEASFEIASVVMSDAFSRPFDVVGNGEPDLQKLPKSRPDFSMFDNEIHLVAERDANVLLGELLAAPRRVAQVPGLGGDSPADKLLSKLSGMGENEDEYEETTLSIEDEAMASEAVVDEVAPVEQPPMVAEDVVAEDAPAESRAELPKQEDGLVDLDAIDRNERDENNRQALMVLGEIADLAKRSDGPRVSENLVQPTQSAAPLSTAAKMPTPESSRDGRGIYDVASPGEDKSEIATNPELRIELSYASSREEVSIRAKQLEAYIPDVIMAKGRFYGFRVPTAPNTFIIGIEARDRKSRDDIVWYLEKMQIPWSVRNR